MRTFGARKLVRGGQRSCSGRMVSSLRGCLRTVPARAALPRGGIRTQAAPSVLVYSLSAKSGERRRWGVQSPGRYPLRQGTRGWTAVCTSKGVVKTLPAYDVRRRKADRSSRRTGSAAYNIAAGSASRHVEGAAVSERCARRWPGRAERVGRSWRRCGCWRTPCGSRRRAGSACSGLPDQRQLFWPVGGEADQPVRGRLAACDTARFPRRTGWSRTVRFGDCARSE